MSRQRSARPSVTIAIVGLMALSSTGCSRHARTTTPPTTAATSQTTVASTTTISPEQAVLAAYRDFWHGYVKAADPMDPRSPVLAQVATGDELRQVASAFLARQSAGEVIRGTVDLAPVIKSVAGSSAAVTDCYADHTGVYDAASGARKDHESGVRHLITAQLVLDSGTWKVSQITREADGCTPASG